MLVLHDLPGGVSLHRAQIEALGADRPAIGFDFAGHANSVPDDGQQIGIAAWVAQIGDVLTALGYATAHLYAPGTAAAVAIEFARAAPARVASLVLHAPPTIGREVAAGMAEDYAPDITPTRDGGNFLRLWHHLRDQELWFPWFEQVRGNARPAPRIAPALLHERAVAMLKQPENYRPTWREILTYDLEAGMQRLTTRCAVVYRDADIFAFARGPAAVLLAEGEAEAAMQLRPWFAGEPLSSAADAATAHPAPATPRAG